MTEQSKTAIPPPGSSMAVSRGCTCPVLDNGRGRGVGNGEFWITDGCPLHAPKHGEAAYEEALV